MHHLHVFRAPIFEKSHVTRPLVPQINEIGLCSRPSFLQLAVVYKLGASQVAGDSGLMLVLLLMFLARKRALVDLPGFYGTTLV